METEMNKWCFIKIFSKNTIAPQLWTFSSFQYSLAGRPTDNQDKEKNSRHFGGQACVSSVSCSVCHDFAIEIIVWNLWKSVTSIKDENCSSLTLFQQSTLTLSHTATGLCISTSCICGASNVHCSAFINIASFLFKAAEMGLIQIPHFIALSHLVNKESIHWKSKVILCL